MEILQQTGRRAWILPAPVSTSGSAVCTAHMLGTYYVHCSEAPEGLIESVKKESFMWTTLLKKNQQMNW